jgi:hypothetical protein
MFPFLINAFDRTLCFQGAFAAGFSMVNANKGMFLQRSVANLNLRQFFELMVNFGSGFYLIIAPNCC